MAWRLVVVDDLVLLLVLVLLLLLNGCLAQQCTVCKDGTDVPFPDTPLNVDGIPVNSCGDLQITGALLPSTNEFCGSIQSIGTLCGCPIPESACRLCGDNDGMLEENNATDRELEGYNASDFLFGAPPGIPMTCGSMQAVLHNEHENSTRCLSLLQSVGETCGCPASNSNSSLPPTTSPAPSVTPIVPCQLCALGGDIQNPNRELTLGDLPVETCADLNNFAFLLDANSIECTGIQSLGSLCGCPVSPNACTLCPNGEPVPRPSVSLDWFDSFSSALPEFYSGFGNFLTCEIMEATLKTPSVALFSYEPDFICMTLQLKSWICGCNPDWKQKLITWGYRFSGMLSFFGSVTIISSILRKKPKKRSTTYHQLVLGISFFDALSSTAYMLVGVLAPRAAGFYLSRGNDGTCAFQGFLIQVGYTSIFYNLGLSLYFMMIICNGWKEHDFRPRMKYVHAVILVCGIGLAFGGLPFYGAQFGTCYVIPPPFSASWLPLVLVYTVPVSIVVFLLTVITVRICHKVYRQELASRKWAANPNLALSRQVFWQSFWYMMAFYSATPLLLVSYYWQYTSRHDFYIFVMVAFLSPCQGLLNSLVYFQRFSKSYKRRLLQKAATMTRQARVSLLSRLTGQESTREDKAYANEHPTDPLEDVSQNDAGKAEGTLIDSERVLSGDTSESERPHNNSWNGVSSSRLQPSGQGESQAEEVVSKDDMFAATRAHWELNFSDHEDDEDDEDDEKDNQRRGFADQSSRDMSSRLAGTFNSMRNLLRKSG